MDVTKTLADLEKEAKKLKVAPKGPTGRGNKYTKADYINALAEKNLILRYGALDKVPLNLKYRLSYASPMLAFQYTNLKPAEQENIWTDPNIWLAEKENGVRGWLIYNPSEGLSLMGRNLSVTDYLPVDYGEKILETIPKNTAPAFAIDVEVKSTNPNLKTYLRDAKGVETETELQAIAALLGMNKEDSLEIQRTQKLNGEPVIEFKLITVLYWGKVPSEYHPYKDLRKASFEKRHALHQEVITSLRGFGLNLKEIKICKDPEHKKAFHEGILENGGEGTIACFIDQPYNGTVNRHRNEWVKIKRSVSETSQLSGMGDTIDGWIGGYEVADENKGWKGLIGALHVYVLLQTEDGEEEHMIARVPNIPLKDRRKMTEEGPDGKPQLKQEYYDRVVEVDGQAISARAKRLTHPRLIRWREDKSKYDCVIAKEFLESQIL